MDKKSQAPKKALLVMDMITSILARFEGTALLAPLLESVKTAVSAARQAGIPVIYMGLVFRKGGADISPDNKRFAALLQHPQELAALEQPFVVHPALELRPEDIIIAKKRFSAFSGNDLELVLRSAGIRHLVLAGVATSGIVLSTIREAADKDYHLSVLSDACADRDPEVHSVLLSKVFPTQAEVLTAAEWAGSLTKG